MQIQQTLKHVRKISAETDKGTGEKEPLTIGPRRTPMQWTLMWSKCQKWARKMFGINSAQKGDVSCVTSRDI